jgi:squalene-hopene/tetraprenyl-beta-curcumene cyclase
MERARPFHVRQGRETVNVARHACAELPDVLGAISSACSALLGRQQSDGHWVGELQGDTILESEYILLLGFLGQEDSEKARKAATYILRQQQADGSWSNYPDGPFEMSVSVKAYFALKVTGHDPAAPYMARARKRILDGGGAAKCNSFTRFYLALLGQLPYSSCPSVPPELILLPRWFYVNLYAMSSWTRTIVVPLSIFSAYKPVRSLPGKKGIRELFREDPWVYRAAPAPRQGSRLFSWTNFFVSVDYSYKRLEPFLGPIRKLAIRRATEWMRHRLDGSDGLGAIFPPMIYTVVALRCLGISDDDPQMIRALKQLEDLMIEEGDTIRLQPCFSPVWDSALTLNALSDTGLTIENEAIRRGVTWLLAREVRHEGDWSLMNPRLRPGGWFFEYRNPHYPDTDDTAMVLMALARTGAMDHPDVAPAVERGLRWLAGMQNRDGGWAAFDRDVNREVLTRVPFADHNAMLDPSCPDIAARVLEAMGTHGAHPGSPAIDRAIAYLERTQDSRGCWPGRWGVNFLYGTWQVLVGLQAIGYNMSAPLVRRAVGWLELVQQPCGGWGETCRSYDDPSLAGQGTPTASQTAWALLALLAAGEGESRVVQEGIDYLLATRRDDGTWQEEPFTGTGFPKVFYLKYHLYSLYFPLMALARYEKRAQRSGIGGQRTEIRDQKSAVRGYRTDP